MNITINTFVDKLPALQTMEDFLYQTLKMGFLLLNVVIDLRLLLYR